MAALPPFIARYEIKQRLGQGGMGAIYLARDPVIDRLVALKLLHNDIASDDIRKRFAQEARASGALTHPNIVTIHDYGEFEGSPFIVMEYIRGETLAALIRRGAEIPVSRSSAGSSRSATRSATPTARTSSIATSSRRT